jgi:hypothetical protein
MRRHDFITVLGGAAVASPLPDAFPACLRSAEGLEVSRHFEKLKAKRVSQ